MSSKGETFLERAKKSFRRIQKYETTTGLPYSTSTEYKEVEKAIMGA
jgi:hypothetical protein